MWKKKRQRGGRRCTNWCAMNVMEQIRKNADLSLSLREARKAMSSMPAPPSPALPVTPIHASPAIPPPTSLFPSTTATKAMTPSFAIPGVTSGGTPKASSLAKSHGFTLPPSSGCG